MPRNNDSTRVRELEARLAEALELQAATSEILRVIGGSPIEMQPVFDMIAVATMRLCHADSSSAFTFDGELIHLAALANVNSAHASALRQSSPLPPSRNTAIARTVLTRRAVAIADVLEDPEYLGAAQSAAGGFRSVLAVPLIREGSVIGGIAVGRDAPEPFRDKQIALLQIFADQAVIAIENVHRFKELGSRNQDLNEILEQQTATSEILGIMSESQQDVQPVFDAIAAAAMKLCRSSSASVFTFDGELIHLAAVVQANPGNLDLMQQLYPRPPSRDTGVARAIMTRRVVAIPDVLEDAEYVTDAHSPGAGFRSVLAVPLKWLGEAIGGISVGRAQPGRFSSTDVSLLQACADRTVIAIQNVRLFREIEDKSRQLEKASQHKSEFLANMSHELRTPLNAIIGFSEVLVEKMFGEVNEKQLDYLNDIHASGHHLLLLINDILDLSKIEAGRMELDISDFDARSALENAMTLVRERAQRNGIALALDVDSSLGMLRGDERKVKQVLLNLLSNALKFTPEGGRIEVRAEMRDGGAEVSVTDTGVGIAPEDQSAVFEEFRQVVSAARKVGGTGLGLAISRKFIELHGGRIWVTSQFGKGSTFAFTLPLP